ncbi:MAG: iron-containing alcohol dehydrogenase, partial [Syntrophobacteraceae bacterium]|nr:iron-containing alcohol dehydrogenase [Syntrophobacteraceae bacterium]
PYLTACTGLDALTHAIEAFVSNAHSPVTDLHALEAIRLLASNLVPSIAEPDNVAMRSNVMLGSLEAGLAFSNAILGAVHAMAHSLGGLLDLAHGECNAILLDHVIAFNFRAAAERYVRIGEAMGLDLRGMNLREKKSSILTDLARLKRAAGIERTLARLGVHRTDVPNLTQKAIKDPCMVTNPRWASSRDIEVVYEEAL